MKLKILLTLLIAFVGSCKEKNDQSNVLLIGNGQMPNIAKDNSGNLHIAYGKGDSIMYAVSDNGARSFSPPALIEVLPHLVASSMRGPQIAVGKNGPIVMVCNKPGDIFAYTKGSNGQWLGAAKVNDIDTIAKEGFLALSADGNNVFAAWLDLRDNKRNKIVGVKSIDGGRTWSKNSLLYASPDSSVCECCKPSVAMKGENVYVMFRNWLHGNRDLYLIQSFNGGNTFGEAKKLGDDSWALNGCPMDGGGLVINDKGEPETVWRRNNAIYSCKPGQKEIVIAEGKSCALESVNGKNIYAWTDNGEIIVRKPLGAKINLGKGKLPLLKSINDEHVLCIWENNKEIHAAIISL